MLQKIHVTVSVSLKTIHSSYLVRSSLLVAKTRVNIIIFFFFLWWVLELRFDEIRKKSYTYICIYIYTKKTPLSSILFCSKEEIFNCVNLIMLPTYLSHFPSLHSFIFWPENILPYPLPPRIRIRLSLRLLPHRSLSFVRGKLKE